MSIFPHWISKPCIRKHKNHSIVSSGVKRFSQNLRACKKLQFIDTIVNQENTSNNTFSGIVNCNTKQHQLTFQILVWRLREETRVIKWFVILVFVKMLPFMNLQKIKPPFLTFDKPNLCNDYILKDPEYIDRFSINFPCHYIFNQNDSNANLLDNMLSRIINLNISIRLARRPRIELWLWVQGSMMRYLLSTAYICPHLTQNRDCMTVCAQKWRNPTLGSVTTPTAKKKQGGINTVSEEWPSILTCNTTKWF